MFRRLTRDRYLSDAELAAFMAAVRERHHVHQPRDYAFFALLANTGIRPSEALSLHHKDMHLSASSPWFRVWRKKKTTTPQFDDLELPGNLTRILNQYLVTLNATDDALTFPIHRRSAARLFHYYARKAGITRRAHLYILRHTAATRLYRSTRDIRLVQALLGHEKPDTTAIYAHIPAAVLEDHAAKFPIVI
jgi:site-specific recombinase XerD